MADVLSSRNHPLARQVRLVASGARRAPADLVLAEGLRVLEEATRSGYPIEAVLYSEPFGGAERERRLLNAWRSRGVRVHRAGGALVDALSPVAAPQGGLALVRVPRLAPEPTERVPLRLAVCCCGIQDPGNLGTILRTAAAAGAEVAITTRGTVSARNPKAVRASAGAFFRLPVLEGIAPSELLDYLARRGASPVRADPRDGAACWEADLRRPTALLLGSEGHGLPLAAWESVPAVRVPMAPGVESLNVAAAAAVVLFEAMRQRSDGGPR